MRAIWISRVKGIAVGLFTVTAAAAGLAVILSAAGDVAGRQALTGFAAVTGLAFVMSLSVLALCDVRRESPHNQQ